MSERRDDQVMLGRDMYKFVSAIGGTAMVLNRYPNNVEYAILVWVPLVIAAISSWVVVR